MGGGTKRLHMPLALTTHRTDPAIDALLGNPDTPAATLRSSLTARVELLRSQIPADIDTRIAALKATTIEDRESADEYQKALDALQAQWRDFKAQVALSAGNKAQKERDLATAQAGLVAVNNSLNFFTRRIGDGKTRVTAAKAEVTAKQNALDQEKATYNAAFDGQNALGPKINTAKNDPEFRKALVEYRDSLMAMQDVMSDARSRQLEIDALLRELAKIPEPVVT
jgi:chromosome segregation ATPase